MLAQRHGGQVRIRLDAQFARIGGGKQRQRLAVRQAARVPQRRTPVEADGAETIRIRQQAQGPPIEARARGQILDGNKARDARCHQPPRFSLCHAIGLPEADAAGPAAAARHAGAYPAVVAPVCCPSGCH